MSRLVPRLLGSACLFALVATGSEAHADSREVAERVSEQWRSAGGHVTTLPSRFLFDDETVLVPVALDQGTGCTHVAIIGARGLSFRARLSEASADPLAPEAFGRATSTAGVVELRRFYGLD